MSVLLTVLYIWEKSSTKRMTKKAKLQIYLFGEIYMKKEAMQDVVVKRQQYDGSVSKAYTKKWTNKNTMVNWCHVSGPS